MSLQGGDPTRVGGLGTWRIGWCNRCGSQLTVIAMVRCAECRAPGTVCACGTMHRLPNGSVRCRRCEEGVDNVSATALCLRLPVRPR